MAQGSKILDVSILACSHSCWNATSAWKVYSHCSQQGLCELSASVADVIPRGDLTTRTRIVSAGSVLRREQEAQRAETVSADKRDDH